MRERSVWRAGLRMETNKVGISLKNYVRSNENKTNDIGGDPGPQHVTEVKCVL